MSTEEYEYATSVEANIAIMREISKIRLREQLPRIMAGVAQRLTAAGVDFSKARIPDEPINDEDWDAIYEDFYATSAGAPAITARPVDAGYVSLRTRRNFRQSLNRRNRD